VFAKRPGYPRPGLALFFVANFRQAKLSPVPPPDDEPEGCETREKAQPTSHFVARSCQSDRRMVFPACAPKQRVPGFVVMRQAS